MTGETFTSVQVEQALKRAQLAFTDEEYADFCFCWLSYRTRTEIADALYRDPSTVKRGWDRVMHYIKLVLSYAHYAQDQGSHRDTHSLTT